MTIVVGKIEPLKKLKVILNVVVIIVRIMATWQGQYPVNHSGPSKRFHEVFTRNLTKTSRDPKKRYNFKTYKNQFFSVITVLKTTP